jgi:phosphohistidine phosphatase SixA
MEMPNELKTLLLLRHSNCERGYYNPCLTDRGKEKALTTACKLRKILGEDCSLTIWCSTARRSRETAMIFQQIFKHATLVEFKNLWGDEDHKEDFAWFEKQLQSFTGENLLIITHFNYVNEYALRLKLILIMDNVPYAEGILIQNGKELKFP